MKAVVSALIGLSLVLAGCAASGSKFEWETASRVKVGMTEPELIATMGGRPNAIATAGNIQRWTWIYVNANLLQVGSRRVSFALTDGRVTGVPNLSAFTAPAGDAEPAPEKPRT